MHDAGVQHNGGDEAPNGARTNRHKVFCAERQKSDGRWAAHVIAGDKGAVVLGSTDW